MVSPTNDDLLDALAGLPLAADHCGEIFHVWYRQHAGAELRSVPVRSVRWAYRGASFWAWRCKFLGEVLHWPTPILADCLES